jgi:hypothetical protein
MGTRRRAFLAAALLISLAALTTPALASTIGIDTVAAVDYRYGYFAATVVAHTDDPLGIAEAHLLVNGSPIAVDRVDRYTIGQYTIFTFIKNANVVSPGDTLTGVASLADLVTTASKDALCTAGPGRKSPVDAVCK